MDNLARKCDERVAVLQSEQGGAALASSLDLMPSVALSCRIEPKGLDASNNMSFIGSVKDGIGPANPIEDSQHRGEGFGAAASLLASADGSLVQRQDHKQVVTH